MAESQFTKREKGNFVNWYVLTGNMVANSGSENLYNTQTSDTLNIT